MSIRNRIVELTTVEGVELLRHPKNWRVHPERQRDALRAVLNEIGFAGTSVARRLPDGQLELIDGHLRSELAADDDVPVVVLDVTEEEADKLLALYDPLGDMALTDVPTHQELLAQIEVEEAGLRKMLAELREAGEADPAAERSATVVPGMDLQPHEHYDYVLVLARSTHEWNELCELLDIDRVQTHRGKIGIGRGIPATQLIALLRSQKDGDTQNRRTKPASRGKHAANAKASPRRAGGRGKKRAK